MPKPNCICRNCGNNIYRIPSRIKKYKHNYCNIKCRSEHNKGINNSFYGKTHTKETKEKISKLQSGKNNNSYGKKLSPEHRNKLIRIHTGAKRTKETKKKISLALLGKKVGEKNPMWKVVKTPETLERMRQAQLGKKHSKETIIKMMDSLNKTLYKLQPENIYEGHAMRSSWEIKFAKYLDEQGIKWDYEPRYFVCGALGIYYPDFYVYDWEGYVEVKGFESKVGMDKFNYCEGHYKENFFMFNEHTLYELGVL